MFKQVIGLLAPFVMMSFFPHTSFGGVNCLNLTPVEISSIAYKDRGSRCEGFYESSVSAGSLELVGLLQGKLDYDLEKDRTLHISSSHQLNRKIHIQGVGIPLKIYYRLDAWLQPGTSFKWPLDIVKRKQLRPRDIGLLGKIVGEPNIYVPLNVSGTAGATSDAPITLTLRASVDVDSVQWRRSLLQGQQCGDMSQTDWQDVAPIWGNRFYSGQAITVELTPATGGICVEFAAQRAGSIRWLKRFAKIRIED